MKSLKVRWQLGPWVFTPGLPSTLITLLLLPCFVYLSLWQWHRSEEKKQFLQDSNHPNRQQQIIGHFLNEYLIFLDNQIFQGHVGYRVITPFVPKDGNPIVWVDRGWVPIGNTRATLPIIPAVKGEVILQGKIYQPKRGFQLEKHPHDNPEKTQEASWPLRLQYMDFQLLASRLNKEAASFLFLLNETSPYVFAFLDLPSGIPASRHLGYALQWFAIAIGVLVYYLVINSRRLNDEI